ncbi:MAG: PIG-L family deacetylase [Deltaproteobacteria bacterium]|nr:PIG-L family deacetylase [Deltaproteobacteria bacterium]
MARSPFAPDPRTAAAALVAVLALSAAPAARAAETLVVPPRVRVLVVAPHPDDESLGAGGLMQEVVAAGGRVDVLFLTNGDGYPEAVEAATGHREPSASDYRAFGELRRAEALVALERYRVLPPSVTFLGFPDGGLAEIWRRGEREPPYESPYTREDTPPYPHAFEAGARYVSRDLIRLIARMVARSAPDWIVLPTPLDNHSDHCASFTFVLAALQALSGEPGGADKAPDRLLTYLVHTARGWPPPPDQPGPLPEPAALFAPGRWFSLPLDEAEVRAKLDALETHRTQAAVMEALFRSFARPNELFAVLEREQLAGLKPGTPACGPELPSRASHPAPTPPGRG